MKPSKTHEDSWSLVRLSPQAYYKIPYTIYSLHPAFLMFNKWYFTSSNYFKNILRLFTHATWDEHSLKDYNDHRRGFQTWTISSGLQGRACRVTSRCFLFPNETGLEILESRFPCISKDWLLTELRRMTQRLPCIVRGSLGAHWRALACLCGALVTFA